MTDSTAGGAPTPTNKKAFLDYLYYDLGGQAPLEVACSYTDKSGNHKLGKWRPYLDVQGDPKFIEKVDNRRILDIEIVLDVDPKEGELQEEVKGRYEGVIKQLDALNLNYTAYFSGSRGYHIHFLFPELRGLDEAIRKKVKETIIGKYDCDLAKACDKNLIALEHCAHWKTGKPKEQLKEVPGVNRLDQIPEVKELLEELKRKQEEGMREQEVLQQLIEAPEDSGIHFVKCQEDYSWLKNIAKSAYLKSGRLVFPIGEPAVLSGKITHPLFNHPLNVPLCWAAHQQTREGGVANAFFLDDRFDARRWTIDREVSEDFWIYELYSNKRKYWLFSPRELELEEYRLHGMLVECHDLARIGLSSNIRINKSLIFVSEAQSRIVKYNSHEELFEAIKPLELNEDKLFNFLFSKSDGKSYRHPRYFERKIGAFLFAAKRDSEDFPLHELIIAEPNTGKTYLEEALHNKMQESQEIVEGSGSTIKKLVPSFKDVRAEPGSFATANRICIVDEFLRLLTRSNIEHREDHLAMLNPLLEHKHRLFGSGNCSITIRPTAKMLAVSNPVYDTRDMLNLCEKIDPSFLSRLLIYYQDTHHIKWVKDQKGIEDASAEIPLLIWISIYDYMQTFTCQYDTGKVREIFEMFLPLLSDRLKDLYVGRYKNHHIHHLMDGIIKLRCLTTGDESFTATNEDYDTLFTIWRVMIEGWSPRGIQRLPSMEDKLVYCTKEQKFIIEKLTERNGRIRDDEVHFLDCLDPMYHMSDLQEMGLVRREGHYFILSVQSEVGDFLAKGA